MGILTKTLQTLARGLGLEDPRLYAAVGATDSNAGERVSVERALQLDAVWACVRLKASTIATLPLDTYRRDGQGRGIEARDHPLSRLLHDRPNSDMTSTEFWEAMIGCMLLWGNAYASIERIGTRIVAITPMRPDRVSVTRNADGTLTYHYNFQGVHADLAEEEVFHLKGFSLDGMVGISPVAQGRNSMGSAIAAERATGAFFKNGMRPSLVMTSPNFLNDAQQKKAEALVAEYAGAVNAGRVPLIQGGWKLEHLSLPPEDAQLLATRSFQVEQICRWFDVPPVMIGHTQSATAWGTGMEQMMLWFLTFSLRPLLKKAEQAIAKSLISAAEQATIYAEFNVEGLLRADSQGRAKLYAVLADHGLRTRNELRALDNEAPLPGGDDLTVQSAMLPIQLLGEFVRGRTDNPLDPNYVPPKPPNPPGTTLPDGANTPPDPASAA